ncbi:phage tail terminator-like protein [Xanthobacter autotrophicus]|uniref:phage tail terminator-like protein n=1 Tax=Xanthobacter autotrophicus TaxID=280 RepID=UPI003728F7FB
MSAVQARLDAFWTRTAILYPNADAQVPAVTAPVLVVQYPVASEDQITIGAPSSNIFREEGAIRLVLQIPRGAGLDPYAGWLDELRGHFRGKQFAGVTTYAASPPVLDDRNDAGKYWSLSCAVPYQFDIFA